MAGNERFKRLKSLWPWYKWAIAQPSGQGGRLKLMGTGLYITVLMLSFVLVIMMFGGAPSTYVDYQNVAADALEAPLHRQPDVIACSAEFKKDKRKFNVQYHRKMVETAMIPDQDLDRLAQLYYDGCDQNSCSFPKGDCEGTKFLKYCHRIKKAYFKEVDISKEYYQRVSKKADLKFGHWQSLAMENKRRNGSWTLGMLWTALRIQNAAGLEDFRNFISQKNPHLTYDILTCRYYKTMETNIKEDIARRNLSSTNIRDLWVGRSLCLVLMGTSLPETQVSYFGCSYYHRKLSAKTYPSNPGKKMWIGDLESTPVEENDFFLTLKGRKKKHIFLRDRSGVLHYKITKVVDETQGKMVCVKQPLLRGVLPACTQLEGQSASWYVDLLPQSRVSKQTWVYVKALTVITKKSTFTSYTRFQFGIGLFGCCVGFSIMQLFTLLATFVTKVKEQWKKRCEVGVTLTAIVLTTSAIGLTYYDVVYYVQNRFVTIFKEQKAGMKIPLVKICTPEVPFLWSLINTTTLYEHNVSLQLYGYLKFAGWLRHADVHAPFRSFKKSGKIFIETIEWSRRNFRPKVDNTVNCGKKCNSNRYWSYPMINHILVGWPFLIPSDVDVPKSRKFFEPLHEELAKLGEQLGLGPQPSLRELTVKLGLHPRKLIKSCWIGDQEVPDCGQYATYTAKTSKALCLTLKLPQAVLQDAPMLPGFNHGLKIFLDEEAYRAHSDFRTYYGPNVSERLVHPTDQECGSINAFLKSDRRFKKQKCGQAKNWALFIQHPDWGTAETEVRLKSNGLFGQPVIEAEVVTTFEENAMMKSGSCWPDGAGAVCDRPKEDATIILRALAMLQKCGCMACYGHLPLKFSQNLAWIRQRKDSHCCTGREYYDCYFDFMERAQWHRLADNYQERVGTFKRYNRAALKKVWSVWESVKFNDEIKNIVNAKQISNADKNLIPSLIPNLNVTQYFSPDLLERMAKFLRECFKPLCKVEALELKSLKTTGSASNHTPAVRIFYANDRALGVETQDVLNPFQMICTLLNSLSYTLGVSFIGLIELALLLVQKLKHRALNQKFGKILKDHLMQGVSVILPAQEERVAATENATETVSQGTGRNVDTRSSADGNATRREGPGNSGKMNAPVKPKMITSPPESGTKRPDNSGAERSPAEESGPGPEQISPDNSGTDPSSSIETAGNMALIFSSVLLLITGITLAMVAFFLATFSNRELTSDMMLKPIFQRPSVVVCTETKAKFKELMKEIRNSRCTVSEKSIPCEEIFSTFMKSSKDRFCLFQDNSRGFHKLDTGVFDLILRVNETFPAVTVLTLGLNDTTPFSIYPVTTWKRGQDMNVRYSVSLKRTETGRCISELSTKKCELCGPAPEELEAISLCCLRDERENGPTFGPDNSCDKYEFSPAVSFKKAQPDLVGRELSIKATTSNMLVFTETTQYSWIEILSALGGFCGCFLEITFLCLLCAAIFSVAQRVNGR